MKSARSFSEKEGKPEANFPIATRVLWITSCPCNESVLMMLLTLHLLLLVAYLLPSWERIKSWSWAKWSSSLEWQERSVESILATARPFFGESRQFCSHFFAPSWRRRQNWTRAPQLCWRMRVASASTGFGLLFLKTLFDLTQSLTTDNTTLGFF